MIFGKNINRYYRKYISALLLGVITLIVVDFMQLRIPEFYRMVINGINEGSVDLNGEIRAFDMDFLLDEICFPMIIVIFSLVIGRFLWRICFFGTAIRVETDIRSRMFDHCKNLSPQYYQKNKVGNLMSLFTNDLETVQECFGWGLLMLMDAVTMSGMAIFKMARMNLLLTLFSLIPMVFLLVAGTIVGKYMSDKWDKRQEAFSKLSDFAQESFSGIAVIKAFVKEAKELLAFRKINNKNEKVNVEYVKSATLLNVVINLFVGLVMCIILGYGGYLVYRGSFNAGQLLEFTGYFTSIIWPVMAVGELIDMTSRGKASMKRIDALLEVGVDVKDGPDVKDPGPLRGDIEFRDLTFRYPDGDYDVLEHVSFSIKAGENVGIIGKTGSGKTTIVDLLLRAFNVPRGTLFIDGHDVNDIPIRTVREHAAYVPQDNFLFSDTIKNNIAFASGTDDATAVEDSAKMADVHDNISEFPDGYETVLGERGVTVSGGQKQRISIARALMKDAPILVMDDSVSAVDTATEKVIIDNLRKNRKGKTTILIAHRISTVEKMDKVVFVEDGKILAVGSHEELNASCEPYRNLVELQKLEESEGEERHE